jgi:hypothetical protein
MALMVVAAVMAMGVLYTDVDPPADVPGCVPSVV